MSAPAYEKMWGRSCQSLIDNPHSYMEGIHPLDQEMMRREDAAMYQTGHIDAECRVLRPDGSVRWVWIRGYPVTEQGQIVRLVGVIEDITERKRSERRRLAQHAITRVWPLRPRCWKPAGKSCKRCARAWIGSWEGCGNWIAVPVYCVPPDLASVYGTGRRVRGRKQTGCLPTGRRPAGQRLGGRQGALDHRLCA